MAVSRSAMMVPGVYVCISDDADRSAMVVPGVYVTALGVAAAGGPATIFASLTPAVADETGDTNNVSLGTKWRSTAAGTVTHGRFYRGSSSAGTSFTVAIYDFAGGSLLASKTASGISTIGWQQIAFDTPVSVAADTDYWAVTYWTGGRYCYTASYSWPYNANPPLSASLGWYYYGTGIHIPESSSTANFFSDVVFVAGGADTEDDLLANNVTSASTVTQPAVKQLHGLLANNVTSASSVSQPAALIKRVLLANDVTSASSVTSPAVHQRQVLDAVNVASGSYVTSPAFSEIAPGVDGLLAEDITSGSYVSTPALVEIGGVPVEPPHTGIGGGPGYYGPSEGRRRYEEGEKRKRRQVAEAIDRAVARLTGEPAPVERAAIPAVLPSGQAVGPAEELDARLAIVEGLDQRIVAADAELASLRDQAMAMIEQARLDDDDEALELLLMVM